MIAGLPGTKRRQRRPCRRSMACKPKTAYTGFFHGVQYGPSLYAGVFAHLVSSDPFGRKVTCTTIQDPSKTVGGAGTDKYQHWVTPPRPNANSIHIRLVKFAWVSAGPVAVLQSGNPNVTFSFSFSSAFSVSSSTTKSGGSWSFGAQGKVTVFKKVDASVTASYSPGSTSTSSGNSSSTGKSVSVSTTYTYDGKLASNEWIEVKPVVRNVTTQERWTYTWVSYQEERCHERREIPRLQALCLG